MSHQQSRVLKRGNKPQELSKRRVKGGEKRLGMIMNLFSLLVLCIGCCERAQKKVAYSIFFMFAFGFCLLPLHRPPTLSLLWSIRLSIHSQKWLWHLLKHPVECSGLKGYPMLWPKTIRFFFFSLRFPSKTPLWHCALACCLSNPSLNVFKIPHPLPPLPLRHMLIRHHTRTQSHLCSHMSHWDAKHT